MKTVLGSPVKIFVTTLVVMIRRYLSRVACIFLYSGSQLAFCGEGTTSVNGVVVPTRVPVIVGGLVSPLNSSCVTLSNVYVVTV